MIARRHLLAGAALAAVLAPGSVPAQPTARLPRLGLLLSETAAGQASRLAALRAGLRERGYVEGSSIAIETRAADGEYARLPALAAELARLRVDVLVGFGSKAVLAARQASTAIPIVAPVLGDPIAIGVTRSLARPDGNVTGSAILTIELFAKQIELLKELVPKAARVAVLVNPANATGSAASMKEAMRRAEQALALKLEPVEVRAAKDLEAALAGLARRRADAAHVWSDTLFRSNAAAIARMALAQRLPTVGTREFAEAGHLAGYGANDAELYARGAYFIDRLLRGAKVADLPIEQATRFELVVNRRTAAALGIGVPASVLLRADRVIE
ncbi:MAG: ABC transporter substrate-binding protein [Burkholderiales bacterium]|nr:ABC transporter substrate-binding protein [Burkholderiales bacterium]